MGGPSCKRRSDETWSLTPAWAQRPKGPPGAFFASLGPLWVFPGAHAAVDAISDPRGLRAAQNVLQVLLYLTQGQLHKGRRCVKRALHVASPAGAGPGTAAREATQASKSIAELLLPLGRSSPSGIWGLPGHFLTPPRLRTVWTPSSLQNAYLPRAQPPCQGAGDQMWMTRAGNSTLTLPDPE